MSLQTIEPVEKPWRITPVGLVFSRDLTDAEFDDLGRAIGRHVSGLQWAIGDWLVYGTARGLFGERYELAAAITGKSYESLSQAYRVSDAFPPSDRVRVLSWTWHREALRLPEDRRLPLLREAVEQGWTRMQFITKVTRLTSHGVAGALSAGRPLTSNQLKTREWRTLSKQGYIQCPHCQRRFAKAGRADA